MRVLRMFHAGRDPAHRARDRALVAAGVEITLVVPTAWPGVDDLFPEPFEVVELPVRRAGDVNRHRFVRAADLAEVVDRVRPDLVDLHTEPFGAVTHQVLGRLPVGLPVVGYSAQNLDKRLPPPFGAWQSRALARYAGLYPCSRQAASVVRGAGARGAVHVVPLGVDRDVFVPGRQQLSDDVLVLALVGRMVAHKGVQDAVRTLAALRAERPTRLLLVGDGPELPAAVALAARLGVARDLEVRPWVDAPCLASLLRTVHVLLVPSRSTRTWVEQFGRVVPEGRACGAVVVAGESGSLPEVVGRSGVLTAEGDADALARAVVALVSDPARWTRLRALGLTDVPGWDEVADRMLALYTAALSGSTVAHRTGRAAAVAEFGPPAAVSGGGRPFALPVLREDTGVTRALARTVDALTGAGRT